MAGEMSWVGKKIHLYNVTMGLYMLDWWERCLFRLRFGWALVGFVLAGNVFVGQAIHRFRVDILVLILLWFVCFNGSRFATDVFESHLQARIFQGANYGMGIGMPSS